jgi:hypothetical protein
LVVIDDSDNPSEDIRTIGIRDSVRIRGERNRASGLGPARVALTSGRQNGRPRHAAWPTSDAGGNALFDAEALA